MQGEDFNLQLQSVNTVKLKVSIGTKVRKGALTPGAVCFTILTLVVLHLCKLQEMNKK